MRSFLVLALIAAWFALPGRAHAQAADETPQAVIYETWKIKIARHMAAQVKRAKTDIMIAMKAIAPTKANGEQVLVQAKVATSGQVVSAQVQKTSGHAALDDTALKIVQRASPMPRAGLTKEGEFEFVFPIRFEDGENFKVKTGS